MQFLLSLLFIKKSFLNIPQGVFKRMTTTQDQRLILNIIGVNKLTVLYLFTLTVRVKATILSIPAPIFLSRVYSMDITLTYHPQCTIYPVYYLYKKQNVQHSEIFWLGMYCSGHITVHINVNKLLFNDH